MQSTTKLNVRPVYPIGVEILNLNLPALDARAPLFERLHDLLLRHGLVLIRKQALSDAQFQQFGELFGTPGHIDNRDPSELPMYTLLYDAVSPQEADAHPPDETTFISALAAYQELAPELETRLAGMHAVYGSDGKSEDIHHPLLRAHPLTGKCVLFLSEGQVTRIAELPEDESTAFLDQLFAHLASDKYVYRHKWKPGDLMIWDHNSIQHKAGSDYKPEQSSCIKRITIKTSSRQITPHD